MIDGETLTAIRREITKQLNIILVGSTANATADGTVEDIQNMYTGEVTLTARPKMMPWGLVSRAPAGTMSVVALQGAGPANRVVLGHRVQKTDNLNVANEGEVMLYDNFGHSIYLQKDKITVDADTIELTKNPTDAVGLASLIKGELTKIATAFSSFIPGSGGASFGDPYVEAGDVASTKVKAS